MNNADKPAFPLTVTAQPSYEGLTKREKIAAMAMQGLLSNSSNGMIQKLNEVGDILGGYEQAVAKAATSSADALLKELEQ